MSSVPSPALIPAPEVHANTLADDVKLVLHLTRNWMLYGGFSFVVFCTVVGAVRSLLS